MYGIELINKTITSMANGIRKRKPGTLAKTTYVNEIAELMNSMSGAALGHVQTNITRLPVCFVKITGKGTKANTYDGMIFSGSVTGDVSSDIDLSSGFEESEPCFIWDTSNIGTTGHKYEAGNKKYIAVVVGYTANEGKEIPLVALTNGGGGVDAGKYQHQVYQMVTDNQSGWDYVIAHAPPP